MSCYGTNYALVLGLMIASGAFAFVCLVAYLGLQARADERAYHGWIANLKIGISFLQTMSIAATLTAVKTTSPGVPMVMAVTEVLFLDIGAARPECLLPASFNIQIGRRSETVPLSYFTLAFSACFPILFMLLIIIIGSCCGRTGSRTHSFFGRDHLFGHGVNLFNFFVRPPRRHRTQSRIASPMLPNANAPRVRSSVTQFASLTQLGSTLIIFDAPALQAAGATLLGFEAAGVFKLWCDYRGLVHGDAQRRDKLDERLKNITKSFKDECNYWQFAMWVRLAVITFFSVYLRPFPIPAAVCVFVTNLVYLALLIYVRPYWYPLQNLGDAALQCTSHVIIGASVVFVALTQSQSQADEPPDDASAASNATKEFREQLRKDYVDGNVNPNVRLAVNAILTTVLCLPVVVLLVIGCVVGCRGRGRKPVKLSFESSAQSDGVQLQGLDTPRSDPGTPRRRYSANL